MDLVLRVGWHRWRRIGKFGIKHNLTKCLLSNQVRPNSDPFLTLPNGREDNLGQFKSLNLLYSTFNYPEHEKTYL